MRLASSLLLLPIAFCLGCGEAAVDKRHGSMKFNDAVTWETPPPRTLQEITFHDGDGKDVDLKQYQGKKNVVLVITRGYQKSAYYMDGVCTYCTTQTSRFIAHYPKFQERNSEVLVVFPIEKAEQAAKRDTLLANAREQLLKPLETVPFPVWIDENLTFVKHLGIEADLSKPATYVLDQAGQVRFAHVGLTIGDRPSVKAILAKLDEINREKK